LRIRAFLNSIFFKVSLLFLFSLAVMFLIFDRNSGIIDSNLKNYAIPHLFNASREIIQKLATGGELEQILKKYNLEQIQKDDLILQEEQKESGEFYTVFILSGKGFYYLEILYLDEKFLFFDKKQSEIFENSKELGILIYLDILLLCAIFAIFLHLIFPLRRFLKSLKILGGGKLGERIKVRGSEEFRVLGREFNKMAQNLENLIEEKDNFIAYASHELKTPISKAKIALSLMDESRHKEMLAKSIENMDSITESFLLLEGLKSGMKLDKRKYKMSEIVFEIHAMLFDDKERVSLNMEEEFFIECDKGRLAIALKNLIDNAIKYSPDKQAEVKIDRGRISVENRGEALPKSLEEMISKFQRGEAKEGKSGYGVGLSIANAIFQAHDMQFAYDYKDGTSVFYVIF